MEKNHRPLLLLFILIGIYSCDYISNPIEPKPIPPDPNACPAVIFPTNPNPHRKVMVEDYTGHKCTNCPQAAVKAVELENEFGDSVIIVAVHAGAYAAVSKPDYLENFTTTAGDAYDKKFSLATWGWPNGLVNRKDYPSKPVKSIGSWVSEVSVLLKTPMEADIQMTSDYNTADSMVCISVQSKFLSMSLPSSTYSLCLFLIQDSIIAPQLDAGVIKPTYLHRHMLRDNINGTWGDSVLTGNVTPAPILNKYRYKVQHDYKGIVCKPKNCYLVAYLYDNATLRVLQAEEVKLIK
jgi:hypothetical protein